jgi:hypothetical protein
MRRILGVEIPEPPKRVKGFFSIRAISGFSMKKGTKKL